MSSDFDREQCRKCGGSAWTFDLLLDSKGEMLSDVVICECVRCGTKMSLSPTQQVSEKPQLKYAS